MTDATADERVLASSKLSKILVCIYVREASRKRENPVSEPIPHASRPWRRMPPTRTIEAQQKSSAHWMALELSCTSRAPTSHDTYRCAGPWEHPQPAKQLSARRLSAMTPKAAKRTHKRRPARRRKEDQKPKSAAAKPPTKAKTKRRLQSLRRRAERQDRTPKLTRRDEHSSLAKSLGVRSLDLFRSFCPHESF